MIRSLLALTICTSIASRVSADDASDLLARAVKATAGSDESMAKRKYMVVKQVGVFLPPNGAVVSTRDCIFALPDRAKFVGEMKLPTGPSPFTVVLNGFGGWSKLQGEKTDLSAKEYEGFKNEAYTFWLAWSLPRGSRSLVWSLEADSKVEGRATRTLKATSPGKATVTLSIDKENSLVLKAVYSGTESNMPASKEYLFAGHKEYDDQRLPAKVTVLQNGKRIEDWTNESYRFPAKLDDKEFGKQ